MSKKIVNFYFFNDLSIHMQRNSRSIFFKCRRFGIGLNIDKCVFMVCLRVILRFIIFK
jgi:hypothetical protein